MGEWLPWSQNRDQGHPRVGTKPNGEVRYEPNDKRLMRLLCMRLRFNRQNIRSALLELSAGASDWEDGK